MGSKSKVKKSSNKGKKKKKKVKVPKALRLSKLRGTAPDPRRRDSKLRG